MRMISRLFIIALTTVALFAEDVKLRVEHDSFVELVTLTFSEGAICRKIDTQDLPYPLRWHLEPAWKQIQFEPEKKGVDTLLPPEKQLFSHCQMRISRRTLVGPLTKGEWKVFGIRQGSVVRNFPIKNKIQVPNEKGMFRFEIAKSAIMRATAVRYGNSTGACREYAGLILQETEKNPDTKKILVHIPEPVTEKENDRTKCRALPQTIAETAQLLEPGKYEVAGPHLGAVELYGME